MGVMETLEDKFEDMIAPLSDNERIKIRGIKNFMFSLYNNYLKIIFVAIFLFWLFDRIKKLVGLEEAMFIQMTTIIIYLRYISGKIAH